MARIVNELSATLWHTWDWLVTRYELHLHFKLYLGDREELCEEFGFNSQGPRVWISLLHSLARSPQTMLAIAWPVYSCVQWAWSLYSLHRATGRTQVSSWMHRSWSPRCGERETVVILKRGIVTWVSSGLRGRNAERYWGKFSFFASFT